LSALAALALAVPLPLPAAAERAAEERPASGVVYADPGRVREPAVTPTPAWLLTQLIPSPELGVGDAGSAFGLRWQLTPLAHSFGIDARLSPWRYFVVEPIVRHSGSIELFVSPEYLAIDPKFSRRFGARAGVRSYFPVIQRGDYLSLSLGAAYLHIAGHDAVAYEGGVHALFGFIGVTLSFVPALEPAPVIVALVVRSF
jgi:hypothetical protein